VVAGLAVLLALFYAEEDWRGKRAWEQFKGQWEAKGERFDWASVVPPPVPDSENFALAPIVASSYAGYVDKNGRRIDPPNTNIINRLRMSVPHESEFQCLATGNRMTNFGKWQIAKWTDLKGWQTYFRTPTTQSGVAAAVRSTRFGDRYRMPRSKSVQQPPPTNEFPIAPQPQTPAADVLLALSRYDAAIAELRQASRLPRSRFPLNYEHPEQRVVGHRRALKECAFVLQLRSVAELSLGRTEEALDDVRLALRLAESVRTEPFFGSQKARIEIVGATLQPVWEGLAARRWSDSQLVAVDSELAGLDFFTDYAAAVRGQRALANHEIDDLRRTHNAAITSDPGSDCDDDLGPRLMRLYFRLFPSGWYYQNQLRTCQAYTDGFLPLLDQNTRTVFQVMVKDNTRNEPMLENPPFLPPVAPFRHPFIILESVVFEFADAGQYAYAQGSVDLARVACALERYRIWRGEYPDSLNALAPRFIGKLPHDVINGQPLHYRLTDQGQFLLYSVGWANKDEGGKVRHSHDRLADVRNGNWVWRYP
jgi:hypothetical protein